MGFLDNATGTFHYYTSVYTPKVGMHDIIRTLPVSANMCFKFKYRISASTLKSADIITDEITGCYFID